MSQCRDRSSVALDCRNFFGLKFVVKKVDSCVEVATSVAGAVVVGDVVPVEHSSA